MGMPDLGQSSTKTLCQSKYNTAPSPGIAQTEASTDEAVPVFTHASSAVTRALTAAAGSETHHQHTRQELSLRQHASSGGSADAQTVPGTGSEGHVRQRDLRLEAAVRSTPAARTGRETEAGVPDGSGEAAVHPAQLTPPRQPPPPQPCCGTARRGCHRALEGPLLGQRRRFISPAQPGLPHAIPAGKRSGKGQALTAPTTSHGQGRMPSQKAQELKKGPPKSSFSDGNTAPA